MISESVLANLRCPEDRSELARAAPTLLERINARIASGQLTNRGGRSLEQPIDDGLVRAKGDVLYPVVDRIPRLLVEDGIPLEQFEIATPPTIYSPPPPPPAFSPPPTGRGRGPGGGGETQTEANNGR